MAGLAPGSLDRRIRIQRPVADTALDGAGSGSWDLVAETWANVQDMLPSRGERLADGINIASRPTRVRIRFRQDVMANMRVLIGRNRKDGAGDLVWETERTAQIITVPAELGRREGLEFMIEDYNTSGNPA